MPTIRVLVVDDDETKALAYAQAVLRRLDGISSPIQVEAAIALSPSEARDRLYDARRRQTDYDLLITDFYMDDEDGLDLIRSLPDLGLKSSVLDVVLVSQKSDALPATSAIDEAAKAWGGRPEAVKRVLLDGSHDVGALMETITTIVAARLEERRSLYYRVTTPTLDTATGRFATVDPELLRRLDQLYTKVAPSPIELPILLQGENGTGKELLAAEIHARSQRRLGPFVKIDIPALSDTLIDSQLFGAAPGSFTGAVREIKGLFERADRGTVYLSEIGYASLEQQQKLLNVLQDLEFEQLGGKRKRVSFRLISATNVNLKQAVENNTFQKDLYYRLNAHIFEIPPLRDRPDDISHLANYFWTRDEQTGEPSRTRPLPPDVLLYLQRSGWPGNGRELEHYIQKMKIFTPEGKEPSVNSLEEEAPVESESYCTGLSKLNGFNARRQHMLFYPVAKAIGTAASKAQFNQQVFERVFTKEGLAFGNTFNEAKKSIDNAWEHHRDYCITCQELWSRLWPAT